jgi:hypothetical protein
VGNLAEAEEATARLHALRAQGHIDHFNEQRSWLLCQLALCRGALPEATRELDGMLQSSPPARSQVGIEAYLAWVLLAQGKRDEALQHLETAVVVLPTIGGDETSLYYGVLPMLAPLLSGMEAAGSDPQHLQTAVERLRRAHPTSRLVPHSPYLAPAVVGWGAPPWGDAPLAVPLAASWTWHDPSGECVHEHADGLVIRAANGRDLWGVNLSAPRLLQPVPAGDYAVQAVCTPVSAEQPAIGGLLLWQDAEHYLVLECGHWGAADIAFRGCLDKEACFLGRGRLAATRMWLRLERRGDTVCALCSSDGREWFTAGDVEFPMREGEQIGVHAIGMIDRTIYHGAYPHGTVIRFESLDLWTAGSP